MSMTGIEGNYTPDTFDEKGRRLDVKARPDVGAMSDIEMLDEITRTLRAIGDVIGELQGLNPQQMIGLIMRGGK